MGRLWRRLLADLIEQLVGVWPVPVRSLSVVGHSMGGLVARSACHSGAANGAAWVSSLTSVVTLGSPHVGAPLDPDELLRDRCSAAAARPDLLRGGHADRRS